MPPEKLVYEVTTAFDHYQVVDMVYDGRQARLLYSGQRQAAQSGMALDERPELLFDYNERLMELIRGLRPANILLIGGGGFTLPRAINLEFPDIMLDVVELDAKLVEIAKAFFDYKPNNRTHIHIGDGRRYIASNPQKYDVILLDAFTHTAVPEPFKTDSAAQDFAECLTRRGVLAMNIIATYNGIRATALKQQVAVLQAVFANIQLFPADGSTSLWLTQNFVLTAQRESRDLSALVRYPSYPV